LNAELNKLRGDLEVLNNSLENAQRRQRDMYLDLDTRVRRMEGAGSEAGQKPDKQLGDLEARIKRLEEAGARTDADLDARVRKLEGQPAPPAAAPAPAPAITTPAPPLAPVPPTVQKPAAPAGTGDAAAARRAYDSALNIYRSGDYQGAIAAFDALVKRYPKDALAPNAQYWIGDAWFNLRDFRAAIGAQQALITNYPDSAKVPDAMLNLSSAQIALGDNAAARKTLEDLTARFPQSDAAEKARQRLAKLK
jgi:tol-pal system protein YbgF